MSKLDKQGVRTAADIERKYSFGKRFSEMLGLIDETRESVDSLASSVRDEITQQYTTIMRDAEKIVMNALTEYVKTGDYDEYKKTVSAEFKVMSEAISANLQSTEERIASISENVENIQEDIRNLDHDLGALSGTTADFIVEVNEDIKNAVAKIDETNDQLRINYEADATYKEECEGEFEATAKQISANLSKTEKSIATVTARVENAEGDIAETLEYYGNFKKEYDSYVENTAEYMRLGFEEQTAATQTVNGQVSSINEYLEKHFEFNVDGLTIKAGENSMNLVLDNDMIKFIQNGVEFGWWDGVDFHTGNIIIGLEEKAQFGNYAFIPRSNGSLDFLKVGE